MASMDEAELTALVTQYYRQLTTGCGSENCTNSNCSGSGTRSMQPKEAFLRATELVMAKGILGLCPAFAPNVDNSARASQSDDIKSASSPQPPTTTTTTDTHATNDKISVSEDVSSSTACDMVLDEADDTNETIILTESPKKRVEKCENEDEDSARKKTARAMSMSNQVILEVEGIKFSRQNFQNWMTTVLGELSHTQKLPSSVGELMYTTFGSASSLETMKTTLWRTPETEDEEKDKFSVPDVKCSVDLEHVRTVFKTLCQHDELRSKLFSSLDYLMSSCFSKPYGTEATINGFDELRVFIILLEVPLDDDPDVLKALLPKLCSRMLDLNDFQRAVLVRWIASEESVSHLTRMVQTFQQYLTLAILTGVFETEGYVINHDKDLSSVVKAFNILFDANEQRGATNRLSASHFFNDGVNENFNERHDFLSLKRDTLRDPSFPCPEHSFSFCEAPFILSVATKVKLLTFENMVHHDIETRNHRRENRFEIIRGASELSFKLNVSRNTLLRDAMREINRHIVTNPKVITQPLKVNFIGEEGLDYGGVKKEFFQLMIKQLFDVQFGMFTVFEETNYVYFNRNTFEGPEKFELIGLLLGLALYNNTILDLSFPPVVYKKLLLERHDESCDLELSDLETLDPAMARGFAQLLTYDSDTIDALDTTFSVEYTVFGEKKVENLCDDGENKAVTFENKEEYVQLYLNYMLNTSVEKSFRSFRKGFWDVCKQSNVLKLFDASELEHVICGMQDLNFEMLHKITKYEGFDEGGASPVVKWFWEIVHTFNDTEKKQLLAFSTGSDRVPIGGLEHFTFCIAKQGADSSQLPTSHTCFNVLMLPEYTSKEKLDRLLRLAIANSQGFGMI